MLHVRNAFTLRNVLRAVQVCFEYNPILKRILLLIGYFCVQIRSWSTVCSSTQPVHLDEQVNKDLENEVYKPKSHPGKTLLKCIEFPEHILDAIKTGVDGENRLPFLEALLLISIFIESACFHFKNVRLCNFRQ